MHLFWFILILISVEINCLKNDTYPDLTLLSKKLDNHIFEYICAAGNNVQDSAVIFSPPGKSNADYNSCYYTKEDRTNCKTDQTYSCNFDNIPCSLLWSSRGIHKIIDSKNSPFQYVAPVIDRRWESFQQHYVTSKAPITVELKKAISFSFSLRSKNGTSFFICNLKSCDSKFFYIELYPVIFIFYCENEYVNSVAKEKCQKIEHSKISFEFKIWQHFNLIIDRNISIAKYGTNEEDIINFENKLRADNYTLKFIPKNIKHNSAYLKIHDYEYLLLDKNKTVYELGPVLKIDHEYNNICLEFYVLTCKNCTIEFSLDGTNKKLIRGIQHQKHLSWQYVKLFIESANKETDYRLKIKKSLFDILAIDDIRRCRKNEYRSTKMTTNETNIACQSLKYPPRLNLTKNKNITYKGSVTCEDRTEIGNNCNISCQALTNYLFCDKYTICKFNNEGKSVCSCAIGYKGQYCENKQPLPYLRDPLTLVNSTMNSITVRLKSVAIEEQDEYKINTFGIEYKEKNAPEWISIDKNCSLSTDVNITIPNLKPDVEYSFRALLYLLGYKQIENMTIASFKTICNNAQKLIEDIQFIAGETDVTLKWEPICNNKLNFSILCNRSNGNIKWCANPEAIKRDAISSLSKQLTFNGLSSFTEYDLIITNDTGTNNTFHFTTMPSQQQTAVQDLAVFQRNGDVIQIRWKLPLINNSISYYQRAFKNCNTGSLKYVYINAVPCNIWPGWLCDTISETSNTDCYAIHIRVMFEDRGSPGADKNIIVMPNKVSNPPEKLRFEPEALSLCWHHPNFTRGQLRSFDITFLPISTALIASENKSIFLNEVPQFTKLDYCMTLTFQLEPSTTYEIRIRTNTTSDLSESNTLIIDTKPIEPELMNGITLGTHTDTTQDIIIPQITPGTITNNSAIYIHICIKNTEMVYLPNNLFDNLTNCNGLSWIAAKFKETNQENCFVIGDLSKNGDDNFIENMPLNESVAYSVSVILTNEYKGQVIHKIYTIELNNYEDISNEWNLLYLLLLLLLIIPILAYIIFKKRQNKFLIPSFMKGSSPASTNNHHLLHLKQMKDNAAVNDSTRPLLLKTSETQCSAHTFSRVVKVENLSQYTRSSLENGELQRQHKLFPKGATKPWKYGMMKENKFKNRYTNLTAYDHSRVVLCQMSGDPFSDFINANYIDGYKQKNAYIATQGPKLNTINDFWRMIWQENVQCIVMLANLTEGTKKKCEKYWPDIGVTQMYIDVSVTYVKSTIYADFEYRRFEVTNGPMKRRVQQLHFTSWPDHGVPLYPQSLVPFLRKMSTFSLNIAPIVVHCSAGVGRTGSIILADICLRMAAAEGQVDVLMYMHLLRENRANLVDNFSQYKLVHMVLLEYLLVPDTNIPCNENMTELIENLIKSGEFRKQFADLKSTAWHNTVMTTKTKMHPENESKNRFPSIVPDRTRIYISRDPYNDEYSDYINAIPVDGFQIKDQFIVTQNPLPNTLKDFWRMVNEQNCKVIVSLNDFELTDNSCCTFWPNANEEMKPLPHFIIQHKAETSFDYFDVIKVQITNQNAEEGNEISSVKIIQFKKWKQNSKLPQSPKSLISLYEETYCSCKDGSPMIITCFDGTTACGVFVTLSFVIEKIKLEQLCNVSMATRVIRCNRKQFIINEDQFLYLYKAALEYVISFEEYGNFQGLSLKQ